jgi:hypothetical protein
MPATTEAVSRTVKMIPPRCLALVALASLAMAAEQPPAEVPPSPSTAPGVRIWPEPCFTHWPAIAYSDEVRNIAFALPNKQPGITGSIGWSDAEAMAIAMPAEGDRVSGLLPLALSIGTREAKVVLGDLKATIAVRVADARERWPLAGLKDGFPVDDHGVPVVLLDRRRNAADERKWDLMRAKLPRPDGQALVVGDPMDALGSDAWGAAQADKRVATDQRYPHHAVLVALANLERPRTIVWCPGNQALFGAAWNEEEERVLALVRTRCEALGIRPRLVLLAPPLPIDEPLHEQAQARRDLLINSASMQGWAVLDLERIAGPAEKANQVRDGLFTRYPTGDAQKRVQQALADELER